MNMRPVKAAADEPVIVKNVAHGARTDDAD
jgi:hypothetical protein